MPVDQPALQLMALVQICFSQCSAWCSTYCINTDALCLRTPQHNQVHSRSSGQKTSRESMHYLIKCCFNSWQAACSGTVLQVAIVLHQCSCGARASDFAVDADFVRAAGIWYLRCCCMCTCMLT